MGESGDRRRAATLGAALLLAAGTAGCSASTPRHDHPAAAGAHTDRSIVANGTAPRDRIGALTPVPGGRHGQRPGHRHAKPRPLTAAEQAGPAADENDGRQEAGHGHHAGHPSGHASGHRKPHATPAQRQAKQQARAQRRAAKQAQRRDRAARRGTKPGAKPASGTPAGANTLVADPAAGTPPPFGGPAIGTVPPDTDPPGPTGTGPAGLPGTLTRVAAPLAGTPAAPAAPEPVVVTLPCDGPPTPDTVIGAGDFQVVLRHRPLAPQPGGGMVPLSSSRD